MNIRCLYSKDPGKLPVPSCKYAISGLARDDRGNATLQMLAGSGGKFIQMTYDGDSFEYVINHRNFGIDDLGPLVDIIKSGDVLCDATTLGFVEILLCIRAAHSLRSPNLHLVYAEPEGYSGARAKDVLSRRDFELTEDSFTFSAIPGSALMWDSSIGVTEKRAVIFTGYEGHRLQQFIEQNALAGEECNIVFGVPAFNAGWEINSFANTIRDVDERRISSVSFAGATNPQAAYDIIGAVHAGVGDGSLFIAPIGTKPHGIAAAFYATANAGVGLVYDHPVRKQGRSNGVGMWNWYNTDF